MNRTDRLNALVQELRAISPRCRSARELSARLGVSVRTVERDISALQRWGVPIRADPGEHGGYAFAEAGPPPPLAPAPAEAGPPPPLDPAPTPAEAEAGTRIDADADADAVLDARAAVARVIAGALRQRRVLRIVYEDRSGVTTERDVEPGVFIGGRGGFWYLVGWCRLREDVRVFRLDRVIAAALTGEPAKARRQLDEYAPDIPDLIARDSALG
ncbi:WYL domain-containing protein [Sphaerisporangium sp. NPDC049002]|uniref:helix-turn-helix transcriptional regulator n=1 Tax=unclassified Sphaerisporangium TaxID=2630420 RepID=UPI0033CED68F